MAIFQTLPFQKRFGEAQQLIAEQVHQSVAKISQEDIFAARDAVLQLYLAPSLEHYIVQLILASRDPGPYHPDFARWLRYGASPRGTIALDRCARAHAWLAGRDYVSPEDIHAVAPDVLRHRLILSFEAEAEGVSSDYIIQQLLKYVPVP